MTRPTIALCMIVKNEAHNIGPLLASVKGCFDEIHITDTGSTDATLEFIAKFNEAKHEGYPEIKIHHFEWVNDFSKARNYSFSHATTDYLFWLDADDELSNAAAFIKWRDTVLHVGHYWVALYNYAFKADGTPVCQFIRERAVKRNHGFSWEYFVHEGLVQKENKTFWPQRANTWWVNHRRSEEDRKQDHMRNLKIYDTHDVEKFHPRMKFYLGKEYVENNMPDKAAKPLLEALQSGLLDPHDRAMTFQYCAQSAFATKHYAQSVNVLMQGLTVFPQRAEYWCLLGDTHLAMGNVNNALHAFKCALNCAPDDMGGLVVLFEHAYNEYPKVKLCDIYLSFGNWQMAEPFLTWLEENKFGQSLELRLKFENAKNLSVIRTGLPKTDDIVITCPAGGVTHDWDENSLKTVGHGGSETACIEVARWLKEKTGRRVKVFQARKGYEVMPSGVEYHPVGELAGYLHNVEPACHIAWRHSTRLTHAPSYVWCHDVQLPGGNQTQNYDKVIALSEFHKNYLIETCGVPEDKIILGFNGINPDDFNVEGEKDPLKVVFSSSPDRGLDHAVDIVKKAREMSGMDIKLHAFYGFDNLRKMGHGEWADRLQKKVDDNADFVIMHGQVAKKVLMKHFKEAGVWLYVNEFLETFCITAYEAMCSHTWPIVRPIAAIPFTMKKAISRGLCDLVNVEITDEASIALWANTLVESIRDKRWEAMDFEPQDFSWEKVAIHFIQEMNLGRAPIGEVRQVCTA